jgi:hypothetical protein
LGKEVGELRLNFPPGWRQIIAADARYLPPLKPGQYGVNRARISPTMRGDRDWRSLAQIRAAFPTRNLSGNILPIAKEREIIQFLGRLPKRYSSRRLPIGAKPTAKDKLIRLIKKKNKKTGKTYYQRAQVARLQPLVAQPITAKKYIKGVDFGYRIKYEV